VLQIKGKVFVRRSDSTKSTPAGVGTELQPGDTLELSTAAVALVLCPDLLTMWQPTPGEISGALQNCPRNAEPLLMRLSQKAIRSRTGKEGLQVIAPGHTALLDPLPVFRWTSAGEDIRYRVSLIDTRAPSHEVWGPAIVSEPQIRYPGRPPLEPEVPYFIRVRTASDDPQTEYLPFILLSVTERSRIEERSQEIERRVPQGLPRNLALAIYFHSQELRQDALDRLASVAAQNNSAPLLLFQARVLEETGAPSEAFFSKARDAAKQQEDLESEAEALMGLSRHAHSHDESANLRHEAATLYRRLGNEPRAAQSENALP
jgi:hypothetical protein